MFESNVQYEDEPYIAIEQTNKGDVIKAIGTNAKILGASNVTVTNPFKHPRSFVGDFMVAQKVLMHGVREVHKDSLRPSPRIIMHQLEKTEGGLTDIEARVLRELASGAGAREVLIYLGERINTKLETFDGIKKKRSIA